MKKSDKIKMPKNNFNQSKNLVYASYLLVISLTFMAWNEVFKGSLKGFSIPSLLAILAFGFMWVHYLTAYLKTNFEPKLDTKKSLKLTQVFVLLAIFAHPIAIISKLNQAGYGMPPASFKNYLGPAGALFISLGTISFLIFLAFEFKNQLKKKPKAWQTVLRLNDLAMLLIIIHGFKLGFVINSGWFRFVWLGYSLSLLYFFYDKYINKQQLKKFSEGFIVALVFLAMAFIGLATSGDTMVKNTKPNTNSSSAKKNESKQYEEGFISKVELARNNGLAGKSCWIAVDGDVYDATGNSQWKDGQHTPSGGQAKCGEDLTVVIAKSPHGNSVLGGLPIVGELRTE